MTSKRVRWSTVTIHEFGVGHGGSAVPHTGPSIGLSREPEFTWSTRVGAMARECEGVRRFSSQERITLLRRAGFSSDSVDEFAAEAKRVRRSRALYYSSEMKELRAQRKRAKAEAKRKRSDDDQDDGAGEDPGSTTDTSSPPTMALPPLAATARKEPKQPRFVAEPDLAETKKLRIDASASPPFKSQALPPLSPCVS